MDEEPGCPSDARVSTSLEMKINLGNYESAACFISLSGVPLGASEAEIEALLDTGRIAYDAIKRRIQLQVNALRQQRTAAKSAA